MAHWATHLEHYTHIIWDWNGTLVDDVHVAVAAVNALLTEHKLPTLTVEEYRKSFGFPVRKYYERIGFDFNKVTFENLCDRFVAEYNHHRAFHAKIFDGTLEVIESLSKSKKMSILSAGSQNHLNEITAHFGVHHYFDNIFGIENNMAESKLHRGHELIKKSEIPLTETILVGDTDHDLEVGQALGIDVLLIANGHQSFEKLCQLHHNVIECRFR